MTMENTCGNCRWFDKFGIDDVYPTSRVHRCMLLELKERLREPPFRSGLLNYRFDDETCDDFDPKEETA